MNDQRSGALRSLAGALDLTSDAEMPTPEIYDQEYDFWPWGALLNLASNLIADRCPAGGGVVDYMCATGMLLWQVGQRRPDLKLAGCDIHLPFVDFANQKRPALMVSHADARQYDHSERQDIIACTAGLHHLAYEEQAVFLETLRCQAHKDSIVLLGEEVLRDSSTEKARVSSSIDLNADLVRLGLEKGWPPQLVAAGLTVLRNDVLLLGEFKRDFSEWRTMIERYFFVEEIHETWLAPSGGGDYIFLCRPK